MNSVHKLFANVSIFLLLSSQIINVILPQRNSVSPIIWWAWCVICIFYVFLCFLSTNRRGDNRFLVLLFLFWCVNFISFFFSPRLVYYDHGDINTVEIIKSLSIALLSFYPFYYFTYHNHISQKQLLFFLCVLFIFYGIDFTTSRAEIIETISLEEGTFNNTYNFVLILPLVFLLSKNKMNLLFICATLIVVLMGAKRGAILCFLAEMMIYLIYLLKENPFGRKHRGIIIFLMAVGSIFIVYYLTNHEYLSQRIFQTSTDKDISGQIRVTRYGVLWSQFFSANLKELFLGYGFAQTGNVGGGLAHQDWIEILIDNGILGGVIYLLLLLLCYKDISKSHFSAPIVKYSYICCLAVWLIKGSFSMVYTSRRCFILFTIIGIIQGMQMSWRRKDYKKVYQ